MIVAPLFGTAMVFAVTTEPLNHGNGAVNLSAQQKSAATEPLVRSATECIVRAVVADPRYGTKPTCVRRSAQQWTQIAAGAC